MTSTPEGIAVLTEWAQCLSDHDVEPRGLAKGRDPTCHEERFPNEVIRIGEIDLACKDELTTIQKLADIQVAEENAYIARGRDYLEQHREFQQAALHNSQSYLTEQGLTLDPATW
ncbi:hypothetical protein NKG05_30915 [Oerskovia sp. M15]